MPAQPGDQYSELFLASLDGGSELELHSCAVEILFRPVGLEVAVSLQMVGEKTQTQLEGHEAHRNVHVAVVFRRQKTSCFGNVALENRAADIEVETDGG